MGERTYYFTVEGAGDFPWDMLAVEKCWPVDEKNAGYLWYAAPTQTTRSQRISFAKTGPVSRHAMWKDKHWPVVWESSL